MKPDREQCLKWAEMRPDAKDDDLADFTPVEIVALSLLPYNAGRNAGLEDAAKVAGVGRRRTLEFTGDGRLYRPASGGMICWAAG